MKKFGSLKNLSLKISWVPKKVGSLKMLNPILGPEKFVSLKYLCPVKNLGPEKIVASKKCVSWKNLGPEKI